jgi:hypothetical protein
MEDGRGPREVAGLGLDGAGIGGRVTLSIRSIARIAVAWTMTVSAPGLVSAQQTARDSIWAALRAADPLTAVPVQVSEADVPVDPLAARAPFGPGEYLTYRVKVGVFSVGEAYMTITGLDDHQDNPVYRIQMAVQGSVGPAKVNDFYQSWFDVSTLQTWRYARDISEVTYRSYRQWEFFPDRMEWERKDTPETGELGSALPIDEIAFIYFMRTLPLEVGKSYTFNRYFQKQGNPVTVRVVRKERREIEGVWYNTIVLEPEIKTDGLFGQGGSGEIHLTDDERRIPVYVKSDIPMFPGSLTLHLQSLREGYPLNPSSRAEAAAGRAQRAAQADTIVVGR